METIPDSTMPRESRRGRWLPLLGGVVLASLTLVGGILWGAGRPEVGATDVANIPALPAVAALAVDPSPTPLEAASPVAPPNRMAATLPQAPAFTLPDLDGQLRSLSDFRGRPVLLFFWATW